MKKFAMLGLLLLAACGTVPNPLSANSPASAGRLTVIKEGYGVVLSAALAYRQACVQRLIPPTCRVVVPQLVRADAQVQIALANLTRIAKLGSQVSYVTAIGAVSDAVNDFKVLASENGVQ